MKVIFLDFDGVLISGKSFSEKKPGERAKPTAESVEALNYLLAETGAKIVVSSVWRLGRPPRWLQCVLDEWGIQGQIIDSTPRLQRDTESGLVISADRGHEIQAWLDDHGERHGVASFVIIDDDSDMAHLTPRLVKTDFHNGFTMPHASAAISLLGEVNP